MARARDRYRDLIVDRLDTVLRTQGSALDGAVGAVARALAEDRVISFAGSGHSHLIAEEAFYRAGGIAQAQAILDPPLMLHEGAHRSTQLERESGRAAEVLGRYCLATGDVVFIASNSGRNAYPVELALEARARGATTVAITSLTHAQSAPSRHPSGKRLFELCDIVLDNAGAYGDAALAIAGRAQKMGPTSTIVGVFLINTILAEAVEMLAAQDVHVDVYESANVQGTDASAETIVKRWQGRVRGL